MFLVMIGLSFGAMLGYPTHLTWWALVIALIISAVWMVKVFNIEILLNLLTISDSHRNDSGYYKYPNWPQRFHG
jgi:hypothetical protein